MSQRPRVVIIGAGFGGLSAARALRKCPADVTLIDRNNHHVFQPLLYQVATAGLTPADIASPIRSILRKQKNTSVLMEEVIGVDKDRKVVVTREDEVPYDYLIIATGAKHSYFGNPGWEGNAPGLKSITDATTLRARILTAFERAEQAKDPDEQRAELTFVVVGGGPTGVEMAGAISELARQVMKDDFRHIDVSQTRVLLMQSGPRVLASFPEKLSAYARKALESLGVEVHLNTKVQQIDAHYVEADNMRIPTRTIIWAAGVMASPAARWLGVEPDRAGRVPVNPDCSLDLYPEVFIIGDTMTMNDAKGSPLPGVSPVAMQQGRYVAKFIDNVIHCRPNPGDFQYLDKGSMATIGRKQAVAQVGPILFTGYPAWMAWLVLHVFYLVDFESRLLVLFQWAWGYFSFQRRSRLITSWDMLSSSEEARATNLM